jgi:hypothetical protein
MDIAREYTEKWHHTQQIFDATARPSTITERRLLYPCLDTFMRALPFTFRNVEADVGTAVAVHITGEEGGTWYVERRSAGWRQVAQPTGKVQCTVMMDPITAWRLVTKRRSRSQAEIEFPQIRIEGSRPLGGYVLDMVSIMA